MIRDKITYEWAVECQDEHGDIQDTQAADSYAEALAWKKREEPDWQKVEIALARTEGNDIDGINWRGYAYVSEDGTLEPVFSTYHAEDGGAADGPDVPQRYHAEVARAAA
jgi:hypothetical protein